MVYHDSFEVYSKEYNEWILITKRLKESIIKSGVKNGVAYVISAHTTTGITVNESLECLESDMSQFLSRLAPEDGEYAHARFLHTYGAMAGNPTGHMKSLMVGNHCVFPVADGELRNRSAQDVYFCEFDGPQKRTVFILVMGE